MSMNIHKIVIFMLFMSAAMTMVTAANIPIKCSSDGTNCIRYNMTTIGSTTISKIIETEINSSEYKSTRLEAEIDTDIFTNTAKNINIMTRMVSFSVFSVYSFTLFFFGRSQLVFVIAVILQSVVYLFIARAIQDVIKSGKGDI